jgi:hypothetical protein
MLTENPTLVARKPTARSRISNGAAVLPDIDGRSAIARRYRDIATAIVNDQGGADRCSESRKQLIRRFAAAAVLAEQLEARLARGEGIDIQEHALLCSTLTRLVTRLGIDRTARDLTPSLTEYLDARYGTGEPAGASDDEAQGDSQGEREEHIGDVPPGAGHGAGL